VILVKRMTKVTSSWWSMMTFQTVQGLEAERTMTTMSMHASKHRWVTGQQPRQAMSFQSVLLMAVVVGLRVTRRHHKRKRKQKLQQTNASMLLNASLSFQPRRRNALYARRSTTKRQKQLEGCKAVVMQNALPWDIF
jgi:hypothetical protein